MVLEQDICIKLVLNPGDKAVKALYKALEADNIDLPEDLELDMYIDGESLIIYIRSRNIGRLRNTLDDIMRCIHGVLKLGLERK